MATLSIKISRHRSINYIGQPDTYCQALRLMSECKNSKIIMIGGVVETRYAANKGCGNDLHISSENVVLDNIAMGTPQGSSLHKMLDNQ